MKKRCPDPVQEFSSKKWLCGCTEEANGVNHGDYDGWLICEDCGETHQYWWDCEKRDKRTHGIRPDTSWRAGLSSEE